ncbi:MAG: AEC family transporter [Bdellovibrionota bacterium]
MANFIVIFICMAAGIVLQRSKRFPEKAAQAFNAWVIFLAYPAVILVQFPLLIESTPFDRELILPVSMAWLLFIASWILFSNLGKKFGWSRATTGALILTAGLGNTSFLGFPLLEALMGPEAVRYAILNDQPGSFLVISTLGLFVAATYAGATVNAQIVATRIAKFPPFVAMVLAIVWYLIGLPGFDLLRMPLERVASTLVPVALFAVGLQMKFKFFDLKAQRFELATGLAFKLFLAPIVFFAAYKLLLGEIDLVTHVTILESAMAPMITAAILATEFDLDTQLANLMVGLGIPISLLTIPIWHMLIS